jgi:hypothetical protein
LTDLDFSKCQIGDEGASALADALKENTTVKSIKLMFSRNIGFRGGSALADALKVNQTLLYFDLSYAAITSCIRETTANASTSCMWCQTRR